jgi:hypothetical protein
MIGIATILGTMAIRVIHEELKDITIQLRHKNALLDEQNRILRTIAK